MKITSYIRPAPVWSAAEVRDFLQRHHPEEYNLIDVGQPKEYGAGHLPGARPVPLEELEAHLDEIDPEKPTIVYGGSGLRGRAAANVLVNAGFREVHSLEGGLTAWEGRTAEGFPEEDYSLFAAADSVEEQIALAWLLERGARFFYAGLADLVQDRQAASLFRELVVAEEHHQATLLALFEGVGGRPPATDFPAGIVRGAASGELMEGGMRVDEALAWTRGRQLRDILELAIVLETNAYDRYLFLRRTLPDENSRRVFEVLSDEERRHLKKLTHLLDHFL